MRKRSKQRNETLPFLPPRVQILKKQNPFSGISSDTPGVVYLPVEMLRTFSTFRPEMVGKAESFFAWK